MKPAEHDIVQGTLGKYELGRELNTGDTSYAFEAYDKNRKRVFMKVTYDPKSAKPWYNAYLEYLKEINRRLARDLYLKQKSVYAYDVFSAPLERDGRETKYPWIFQVFPFVSGNLNLRDLIEKGYEGKVLDWAERKMVANIFTFAMENLHTAGIVHGDLKPDNVQIVRKSTPDKSLLFDPLIVDMDLSLLVGYPLPWKDDPGKRGNAGTPGYYSPEHYGKTPELASDVFTSAIILCQLLAGVHPFGSSLLDTSDTDAYQRAVRTGRHDFLKKGIPFYKGNKAEALEKMILDALSPDPRKRPTMKQLHKTIMDMRRVEIKLPPIGGKFKLRLGKTSTPSETLSTTKDSRTTTVDPSGEKSSTKRPPEEPPKAKATRLVVSGVKTGQQKSFGINSKIGRSVLKSICGDDAKFADNIAQFSVERDGNEWFVVPNVTAKYPTGLNKKKLVNRTHLSAGDTLCVGRSDICTMKISFKA